MKILNKITLNNLKVPNYFNFVDFKEERTRKFTTLVLTLISLTVLGLFAINPTISTITKLRREIDDSKAIDDKLTQKINNLSSLQNEYIALEDELPIIYAAIPQTPEAPLLIAQLQEAAAQTGVELLNTQTFQVDVEKPGVSKRFSAYSFSLTADGQYQNLLQFLSTITNMERVVSVDIISITRKTGETDLQLTFKGRAYFNR